MNRDERRGAQAVHRAISLLRAFSAEDSELGVSEASRKVGLHVATTHRLLQSLLLEGLVSQDPQTARYRLGVGLIPLGELARRSNVLPQIAEPHARRLAEQWGEAVNLDVFNHEMEIISIVEFPSSYLLGQLAKYTKPLPPHCVSTGKVLLAHSPASVVRSIVARGLMARTSHTIIEPSVLRKELEEVRKQGYAANLGELEEGLHAVGAPVRNGRGEVVAALSMGGPATRVSLERLPAIARSVIEAANRISVDLGWKMV